jgi:hypothetical protein
MDTVMNLIGGSREAGLSVLFAFAVPHLLQWLKASNIPLMQEGAARLNRAVAFVTAILVSIGVHWTFAHDTTGWVLTFSGAHLTAGAFLLDVTRQFMLQQGRYHVLANGPGGVNVSGALRDKLASGTSIVLAIVAAGALLVTPGCGATVNGNMRHQAVVGNTAIYETLASIQDSADGLRASGAITAEQRRAISVHLLPALKAGRDLVHVTQAWKPGTPAPLEFMALAKNVQALAVDVVATMPEAAQKLMLAKLETIKDQLLNLFVKFAGGEPAPSFDALVASFN